MGLLIAREGHFLEEDGSQPSFMGSTCSSFAGNISEALAHRFDWIGLAHAAQLASLTTGMHLSQSHLHCFNLICFICYMVCYYHFGHC